METITKTRSVPDTREIERCSVDPFIPTQQLGALDWGSCQLDDMTQVIVEDGWVTFDGDVPCCLNKSHIRVFNALK